VSSRRQISSAPLSISITGPALAIEVPCHNVAIPACFFSKGLGDIRLGGRATKPNIKMLPARHAGAIATRTRISMACASRRPRKPLANANDPYPRRSHGASGPCWADGRTAMLPHLRSLKEYPAMKTIISALIALSVLTGLAASASAFDAKGFYEELDRSRT